MLFIQAVAPFCEVVLEGKRESIEVFLSMQEIELYMGNEKIFRVHRKYFVAPEKVKSIRKKNSKDYELILEGYKIPIGKTYLKKLKETHSFLFNEIS